MLSFSSAFWATSLSPSVTTKDAPFAAKVFFITLTILLTFCGPIVVTILNANFDAGERPAAWMRWRLDHSYL